MRRRFEQQLKIGQLLIEDTEIPTAQRNGALPGLFAGLKKIYVTPEWNEKVFEILEEKIFPKNNHTGRPGLNLWQIFVMAQVRMCKNLTYDDLHYMINTDKLLRQLMGIETDYGYQKEEISYRRIIDNVSLLDDEMIKQINNIIVELGHNVFKKKEAAALCLKTDSFVVESNVHFPTDYNLLWDSARKCIDMVSKLQEHYTLEGWRKISNWRSDLKNKMRALGRASGSGGKGKQEKIKESAQKYLIKAKALQAKLEKEKVKFPQTDIADAVIIMELEEFMTLLDKHIDLLERRVIKGEKIAHEEKMFSIFEQYTEWVTKGKMRPNVELGKKLVVTTDQYNLIVDYQIMEHESDSEIVPDLSKRIFAKYNIANWSFDKGFWSKENKEILSENVSFLILPKKGKCNKLEYEQEHHPRFIKMRNKHSAVESNINELEHRGLDRCPDKGYPHFKRYVSLSVCAYNLKKIGDYLIEQERLSIKALKNKSAA
jgi:hypothetical protein